MTQRRRLDDHKEARIFHVHPHEADESRILSPQHHVHRHPKGHGEPREHPDDARHFFGDIARGLDGVDSVLIVGPASAKHEFFEFVHENHRPLASKIVGVETRIIRPAARSSRTQEPISGQATEWGSRRMDAANLRISSSEAHPYGQGGRLRERRQNCENSFTTA